MLEEAADAGVTLVDETGEPLALATEEAAEALAGGDPWYKIGAVTYNLRHNTGRLSIVIAVNGLPSDGMIYVNAGIYPELVTVDATAPGSIYKGFKGLIGSSMDGIPDVELNGYIYVNSVESGFTIKGFDVNANWANGGIHIINSKGTIKIEDVVANNASTGYAIGISNHNGAITLNRVVANNNINGGAIMDNTAGTAGVTITNSSFDYNDAHLTYAVSGLTIYTKGAVLLDGISASHNTGVYPGVSIAHAGAVTIKNGLFNNNVGSGLDVTATGAITLTTIWANDNSGTSAFGVDLSNEVSTSSPGVTITNGIFNNNYGSGLRVTSKGNIIINNTSSTSNDGTPGSYGADLNNAFGTGYVKITNLPSTDDDMKPGFDLNHDRGVNIHTNGTATLTNVNIQDNQEEGIYVWQELNKGVTLTNCRVDGNGTSFSVAGILVNSLGPIVIKGGHANNNNDYGVWVHNDEAPSSKPVTISNFQANNNVVHGLFIQSKGTITLTNVEANSTDSGVGADLDNCLWDGAICVGSGNVTINGTDNEFQNNELEGLKIFTKGAISISHVDASGNGGTGARLNNYVTGTTKGVTVSYSDFGGLFTGNGGYGVDVHTNGSVTFTDASAKYNGGDGARIWLHGTSGTVKVTKGGFSLQRSRRSEYHR